MSFADRYGPWAVVTGASDGIGRAMAEELARRGLQLVLVARRREVLEELAASLPVPCRVVVADLATGEGVQAVERAVSDLDVGLLVAAAGFGSSGPFLSSDVAVEEAMLAVNCGAVLRLTHSLGQRLVARGRGGVVLFGSIVGFQGVPGAAHYAATKAWVQALAEGLHHELAPQGVHVTCAAPGPVHSGFAARADMQMGRAVLPDVVARETLDGLGRVTVVPGGLSKLLTWSLSTAPRGLRVRIMERVMGGMIARRARLEVGA